MLRWWGGRIGTLKLTPPPAFFRNFFFTAGPLPSAAARTGRRTASVPSTGRTFGPGLTTGRRTGLWSQAGRGSGRTCCWGSTACRRWWGAPSASCTGRAFGIRTRRTAAADHCCGCCSAGWCSCASWFLKKESKDQDNLFAANLLGNDVITLKSVLLNHVFHLFCYIISNSQNLIIKFPAC